MPHWRTCSVIVSFPLESIQWVEPLDNVSGRHRPFPSYIDFKTILRGLGSEHGLFKSACFRQEFWNIRQFSFDGYVGVRRAKGAEKNFIDGWCAGAPITYFLNRLKDCSLYLNGIDKYEVTYHRGDPKIAAIVHH
jgi:hypothetical protein